MIHWTDDFIGVAQAHGKHLLECERFPAEKVHVISYGVDAASFHPLNEGEAVRRELGFAPTAPVIGIVAALDAFAWTSRIEANPVSILEAMASGKPMVAPQMGSIGESVIERKTGFFTEPDNMQQVADRLTGLAGDPQRARRIARAGRAVVVERWSLERIIEGYERLIATIYRKKCRAGAPATLSGLSAVRAGLAR